MGYLREAVTLLEEAGLPITRRSSLWETEPVPADQPEFLNAVIAVEAADDLEPLALLAQVKAIEEQIGRTEGRRWGPRVIDIDILFMGDAKVDLPELSIPHVSIAERAFVLAPLEEVLLGPLLHLGATATELWSALGPQGIRRTGLEW